MKEIKDRLKNMESRLQELVELLGDIRENTRVRKMQSTFFLSIPREKEDNS